MCGYKHAFSRNLILVIAISLVLILVMSLLSLVDLLTKRKGNRRCFVFAFNFNLRFVYEFFLEICLSAMIHIASKSASKETESSPEALFLWMTALVILLAMSALVIFTFSRFFWNGPFVSKSYRSGSLCESWWGLRPLS